MSIRLTYLWLIVITLGLLALMMDVISLTGFLLPVIASGALFVMRINGLSWKRSLGIMALVAGVIAVVLLLIAYLLLPLAFGLIIGFMELLSTGRTTVWEGFGFHR
jgi:hypothetical protein